MPSARVYSARSLDELRAIEFDHAARGIQYSIARLLVKAWAGSANGLVSALKLLFFRSGNLPREQIRDIVAYVVGTLGDNIVTLAALASVRRAFPDAAITVIANTTGYEPALAQNPFAVVKWLDRVVLCRQDPVKRTGLRWTLTCAVARSIHCDLFINFSRFGNTGWIGAVLRELALARSMHATWVAGFAVNAYNRHGRILNRIKQDLVHNEPRRSIEVVREIGLSPLSMQQALPPSSSEIEHVAKKLGQLARDELIFVINPGAKFKVKRWPVERFGELSALIQLQYRARLVITGTASERALGEEIVKRCGDAAINLCGQTSVAELIELLRMAAACVTNDTGTMHIAAELGIPTVALFTTRMSPAHWFPKGPNVIALFAFSRDSYTYTDEGESASECLMQIGVHDVLAALQRVLPNAVRSATPQHGVSAAGR